MFIFAWLKYNDKSFWDTIVPLARIGITGAWLGLPCFFFGMTSELIKSKQVLNTDSLSLHRSLPMDKCGGFFCLF